MSTIMSVTVAGEIVERSNLCAKISRRSDGYNIDVEILGTKLLENLDLGTSIVATLGDAPRWNVNGKDYILTGRAASVDVLDPQEGKLTTISGIVVAGSLYKQPEKVETKFGTEFYVLTMYLAPPKGNQAPAPRVKLKLKVDCRVSWIADLPKGTPMVASMKLDAKPYWYGESSDVLVVSGWASDIKSFDRALGES